ncbi:MAG: GUN4 domain-containing protein [Cyanobacteria bacterium P01_G01_bin.39]
MTGIKIIKIFLASSSELKGDREQFEIFINRKNKEYIKQNIFLELVIWEDFLDAMSATRLQDEYNKAITDCDIFISLFKTKVGRYTESEFTQAFQTFKVNNRPQIYTYFQDAQIYVNQVNMNDLMSLHNFKEKLRQLGHYHTSYSNIDKLTGHFSEQLIKLEKKLVNNFLERPISNSSQLDELEILKQELKDIKRSHNNQLIELEQNIQLLQSQNKQLEQQLAEKRSQQQQSETSQQSQIEEKESEIVRLQNIATSQQENIEELNEKLKDLERSHSNQLEEIQAASRKEKQELEQQLEQEKSSFNQQQAKIAEKDLIITQLEVQIEQLKSDLKTTAKNEVELKSARGIDYRKLRDLLAAGEWREADQETSNVMLKVANRQSEGWLRELDIDNFPCEDLLTINQLWLHFSDGQFGFSVQKEIYESLGGTREYDSEIWKSFGDRVGWRNGGKWLNYDELSFTLSAKKGHFPIITIEEVDEVFRGGFQDMFQDILSRTNNTKTKTMHSTIVCILAQRLVTCRL